jgi:hypothetical protein
MNKEYYQQWSTNKKIKDVSIIEELSKDICELNTFQEFLKNNFVGKDGKIKSMKIRQISLHGKGIFENKCVEFFKKPQNYHLTTTNICNLLINNITSVPKCAMCENFTKYKGYITEQFSVTCSQKCYFNNMEGAHIKRVKKVKENWIANPEKLKNTIAKREQTIQERYGVHNISLTKQFKEKYKATCQKKFGKDSFLESIDEKTKLEYYKKGCETYLKNTGYESTFKNPDVIKEREMMWLKKYGERNPILVPEILDKAIRSSFKWNKYKDTDIVYQGSYELYFLDLMNEKGLIHTIENGPKIPYYINGKKYLYLVDFKIKDTNKLIEIKSSYTYNRMGTDILLQQKNEAKWEAAKCNYNLTVLMGKKEIKFYCSEFQE